MQTTPRVARVVIHSERGGDHAENEDVVLAVPHPGDQSLIVAALADGQGGRSGGAEAAQIAAREVISGASKMPPLRLRNTVTRTHAWTTLLTGADEAVEQNAVGGGFCTLIGLCIGAGVVAGASCGDSGVLLVRKSGEAEWLTKNQRKNPPVGSGAAHPVAFSARFAPGDTLIVMSDGAFRYVGDEALVEICRHTSGPEIIAALRSLQIEQNRASELYDDFSLFVAQL